MEITKAKKQKNQQIYLSMEINTNRERHTLSESQCERDLGVLISKNLKFDAHVKQAAAKASLVLGQLKRTFKYWTLSTFKKLYSAYVRPHLEHAAPFWSPKRAILQNSKSDELEVI